MSTFDLRRRSGPGSRQTLLRGLARNNILKTFSDYCDHFAYNIFTLVVQENCCKTFNMGSMPIESKRIALITGGGK